MLIAVDTATSRKLARRAIERAVNSDSVVDVAIDTCNSELHTTKHPMTSIMCPVLDLTESGLVPYSVPKPHAKVALTN